MHHRPLFGSLHRTRQPSLLSTLAETLSRQPTVGLTNAEVCALRTNSDRTATVTGSRPAIKPVDVVEAPLPETNPELSAVEVRHCDAAPEDRDDDSVVISDAGDTPAQEPPPAATSLSPVTPRDGSTKPVAVVTDVSHVACGPDDPLALRPGQRLADSGATLASLQHDILGWKAAERVVGVHHDRARPFATDGSPMQHLVADLQQLRQALVVLRAMGAPPPESLAHRSSGEPRAARSFRDIRTATKTVVTHAVREYTEDPVPYAKPLRPRPSSESPLRASSQSRVFPAYSPSPGPAVRQSSTSAISEEIPFTTSYDFSAGRR